MCQEASSFCLLDVVAVSCIVVGPTTVRARLTVRFLRVFRFTGSGGILLATVRRLFSFGPSFGGG